MGKRIHIILLSLIALATGSQPAFAQPSNSDSIIRNSPSLAGGLENNNGQIRLNLTNNSSREFRGAGVIGIGDAAEQKEIGQLALTLPPQQIALFALEGVQPAGNQFSLKIFDQTGALVFYKIAPIKHVSDSTPALRVTLSPVPKQSNVMASSNEPAPSIATTSANNPGDPTPAAEVTIKGRLLAGQSETEQFIVAFEMTAARPVFDATMTITLGKHQERKPVSVKRDLTVEFKLPDQPDSERIGYELTAKNGRVIAQGELDLGQLMAEDSVTVSDIRTDKPSYDLGEAVQVTLLLEGGSPRGYRLEVSAKDGQGNIFFQDQYQSKAAHQTNSQGFTISLPREITSPVVLEFKIYDGETGLLFDSGEREIPVNDAKRRP